MKTFNELRKINVNQHIEKKGNLSYLSWAWAVDYLLQEYPAAVWEFPDPKQYGESVMVFCNVTAFGKTMKMHLPVMDNKNNAIKNPDSRKISDAQMRCLAKCIATFGIGLYIYAGEDVPSEDVEPVDLGPIIAFVAEAHNLEDLKIKYVGAVRTVKNDQDALKQLEAVKDKRKAELTAGEQ